MSTCESCIHAYGEGNIVFCAVRNGMAKRTTETCNWHTASGAPIRPIPTVTVVEDGMVFEMCQNEIFLISQTGDELNLCPHDCEVIVDVGAHVGTFAVQAAKRGAKVYAVEPSPGNVEILKANIERNKLEDRIVVIQKALSTESGRIAELRKDGFPGQKSLTFKDGFEVDSVVETISVEDLMEYVLDKEPTIDFMKIDIEGEEFRLMEHGRDRRLSEPEFISISLHSPTNTQYFDFADGRTQTQYYDAMVQWLKSSGFPRAWIHKHNALGSHHE